MIYGTVDWVILPTNLSKCQVIIQLEAQWQEIQRASEMSFMRYWKNSAKRQTGINQASREATCSDES